jgi:CxC2 like cysteine cluster associated with KDZ transposases
MRRTHRHSPFHRIEYWTGFYFRRAALWEVGTYILVEHHREKSICGGLRAQMDFLEKLQVTKDNDEQEKISGMRAGSASASASSSHNGYEHVEDEGRYEKWGDGGMSDPNDLHGLDHWDENPSRESDDVDHGDFVDGQDDANAEGGEADIQGFHPYLESWRTTEHDVHPNTCADPGDARDADLGPTEMDWIEATRPISDALNNTYVRVVHTNGIHHLAMVTCLCQGEDNVPLDLVASRLLPASFIRIRTLFTAPVMDHFRLCNLELKASAYQFYQLICRLTRRVGNAEIVNLYHEFRWMSRLWRWMKKLKWAGYGHNQQDPHNPPAGSLANYCPTCPQPGINLPEDWKGDSNRCGCPMANQNLPMNSHIFTIRFVFKLVLVADGNFKADHVRQKSDGDIWLMDGAGMAPNHKEYITFVASAIERFTVRTVCQTKGVADADADPDSTFTEGPLREYIPGHSERITGFQSMRPYWGCRDCLCTARVLCAERHGRLI